jgi:uncharacterized protein (TIGR00290 family)
LNGGGRALVSWSSGKDSAWALETVRREGRFEIAGILTTVTEGFERVSMHGVREEILELQAERLGLSLATVRIPRGCVNADYECALSAALARARAEGVTHVVFGDLFLEDVRRYREERFAGSGLQPLFPLWGLPTRRLAEEMLAGGLEATIVCLDPKRIPASLAGRRFDARFLQDLGSDVDPCGENGEFHTCVTGGPMFRSPVPVVPGETVERDGFVFADILPASSSGRAA